MNAHNEQQSIIAGALFDLMGYLTCREKKLHLSASDDAAPAVEALTEWAEERGFDLDEARVTDWQAALAAQPSPVVKQNLTTQPAAAQEAVGWQWRWLDTDNTWSEWVDGGSRKEIDARFARWKADGEDHRMQVRPLFAAPVTTAPAGVTRAVADEAPFGLNAAERAAWARGFNDALEAAITPAAPGIDLEQFRALACFGEEFAFSAERQPQSRVVYSQAKRLHALIDASPKGTTFPNDENSEAQFIGDGERLNCQVFGGSGHVEDSPKGGSEARDAVLTELVEAISAFKGKRGAFMALGAQDARTIRLWSALAKAQAGIAEVQP